jgi:hypothetical protein
MTLKHLKILSYHKIMKKQIQKSIRYFLNLSLKLIAKTKVLGQNLKVNLFKISFIIMLFRTTTWDSKIVVKAWISRRRINWIRDRHSLGNLGTEKKV